MHNLPVIGGLILHLQSFMNKSKYKNKSVKKLVGCFFKFGNYIRAANEYLYLNRKKNFLSGAHVTLGDMIFSLRTMIIIYFMFVCGYPIFVSALTGSEL